MSEAFEKIMSDIIDNQIMDKVDVELTKNKEYKLLAEEYGKIFKVLVTSLESNLHRDLVFRLDELHGAIHFLASKNAYVSGADDAEYLATKKSDAQFELLYNTVLTAAKK